ncbi:leukocyte immunoglobulin-like receptor subfamily B member 2 [Saccopteryx bilineata]|uniref:leukocyte immunoglobulin-like receptor subfamily B member 2 n=1 Tax=Saccopteryx bilineata TaxID=59482 RepID=UPI00338EAAB3
MTLYGRSSPSNSRLVSPGVSQKPSLLTQQGRIMVYGKSLTFQCHFDVTYNRFVLIKKEGISLSLKIDFGSQAALSQANLSFDVVKSVHRGGYRCYGGYNLSSKCLAPSDPVDILVAGEGPMDSVKPGTTVASGKNVTLLCQSTVQRETFFLSKEGSADLFLHLTSELRAQQYQAEFSMSPVTPDHGGIYRCYSSDNMTPTCCHIPVPLELLKPGEGPLTLSFCQLRVPSPEE